MNGIKKEVYVLRDALKGKINYVEGNTMIPIELHIADFVLPTDSAAVVYALAVGMTKPKKIVAEVKNNSVIFIPEGDFFKKGINVIQVRIVSKTQTLITFKETVECKEKMNFDDAGEVEKQETLVEQLLAKVSECLGEIKSSEQRITEKVNAEAEIRLLADNNHNKKIGNLEKVYNERIINEEDLKLVTEVGKIVDAILIKKLNEDINTTNESLSNTNNKLKADYIVENYVTSDGSAMYRKWNSGLLEVWLSSVTVIPVNIAWGNVFRSDNQNGKNYPEKAKFITVPIVTMTVKTDLSDVAWITPKDSESKTRLPNYYLVRGARMDATAKYFINAYAVGRWK